MNAATHNVEYGTGPCGCGQTEPCCDSCLPPSRRMYAGAGENVMCPHGIPHSRCYRCSKSVQIVDARP